MRGRGAAPGSRPAGVGAPGAARGGERRGAAGGARGAREMQCAEGAAWGAPQAGLGRARRPGAGPPAALELGVRWSEDPELGTASQRSRGLWRAGREVYLGDLQGKAPGGMRPGSERRLGPRPPKEGGVRGGFGGPEQLGCWAVHGCCPWTES